MDCKFLLAGITCNLTICIITNAHLQPNNYRDVEWNHIVPVTATAIFLLELFFFLLGPAKLFAATQLRRVIIFAGTYEFYCWKHTFVLLEENINRALTNSKAIGS
jgi:hypothetical protein